MSRDGYDNEADLYTSEMAGSGQFGICGKCGKGPTDEGHDGCIGTLPAPNVMNACCGHGSDSSAYVQFWDEQRLSGVEALRYIKDHRIRRRE